MYLIYYVVEKDKEDLFGTIFKNIDKFSHYIVYKSDDDPSSDNIYDIFEGTFNKEEITIDFEGEVNFIKLFIKYSHFLNYENVYQRVLDFEKNLWDIFNVETNIYRVDEILLEQLILNDNEFWYKRKDAVETFKNWIGNEEKLHWQKIGKNDIQFSYMDFLKNNS